MQSYDKGCRIAILSDFKGQQRLLEPTSGLCAPGNSRPDISTALYVDTEGLGRVR